MNTHMLRPAYPSASLDVLHTLYSLWWMNVCLNETLTCVFSPASLINHSTKSLPLAYKCVRFTNQKKVLLPQILVISVEIAPFLPTSFYHTVSMLTISPFLRFSSEATLHWPSCQIFNQHCASRVTSDLHIPSEMVMSPTLDSLNLHF